MPPDIVGYSRMIEADEGGRWPPCGASHEVMDPLIAEAQGPHRQADGDGAIVESQSVVDAVKQPWLFRRPSRAQALCLQRRIVFRIGINLATWW